MDFYGLFISTGVVALAEIGDKTQLLSLMLAARYPKHAWPIVSGILVANPRQPYLRCLCGSLGS